MILITGATGQVGSAAMNALVAAGAEVRALVRRPSGFAGPEGVQVVQGSFDDDRSLARALAGVHVMLLAGRDSPDSVSQHQRVLAQARRAEVRHIVKLSAIGASPGSPVALMREHHEVDEEVRKGPAGWTLLKPHLYMQNLLRAADAVRHEGRLAAPMGRARFPLVDTRDVGAAAAVVLGNSAAHAGKAYALTGPVAHSYDEVAAAFATVAGHAVAYEPVAPEDFQARLLAAGIPDWRAFDLAHIASAYSAAENAVSPDLPMLLGRKPMSLFEFLEDHRNTLSS
ncbi:MAG: NmrA family NAD(P)-binding protein [Dongiaceae bacterium]